MIDRKILSDKYIRGVGIELGAFHNPWPYNSLEAKVKYIDKADKKTVLERHPDLCVDTQCVQVDLITDGQSLDGVPDRQYNFVIASHVLEHCPSPLTAIKNHLRVLMQGGHAIYALPDKRHTFDRDRKNPTDDCLMQDHLGGGSEERIIGHYHEYLENVDGIMDPEVREKIAKYRISNGMDVHFHAWDVAGIYDLFYLAGSATPDPFEVVLFHSSGHEVFVVLRRN